MKRLLLLLTIPVSLFAADLSVDTPQQFGGNRLDVRTESTNQDARQVVVVGDPSTNAGVAPVDSVAGLTVNLHSDNLVATYAASTATVASVASATDVCSLYGSATKTIRIQRISWGGSQTTAGNIIVQVVKRSALNVGVVQSTPTVVPLDSTNAAGTAVMKVYTANPSSLGNLVGIVHSVRTLFPAPATTAFDTALQDVGFFEQPITLRGIAEGVSVNLNSTTLTGGSLFCNFEWTEE